MARTTVLLKNSSALKVRGASLETEYGVHECGISRKGVLGGGDYLIVAQGVNSMSRPVVKVHLQTDRGGFSAIVNLIGDVYYEINV